VSAEGCSIASAYRGLTFSDPYGLKVCYGENNRDQLVKATQEATNTTFDLDDDGCVKEGSIKGGGDRKFSELTNIFRNLVGSDTRYDLELRVGGSSGTDRFGNTSHINTLDAVRISYNTGAGYQSYGGRVAALVAHELLGHSQDSFMQRAIRSEVNALRVENLYLKAVGMPLRIDHSYRCTGRCMDIR